MASTYPLEVVQADRWANENKKLKGDQLKAAADKQDWDDSVKSLVATPDVLTMMSTKLDWTQNLGDAVSAQQPDVMDAIQRIHVRTGATEHAADHEAANDSRFSRIRASKSSSSHQRSPTQSTSPTMTRQSVYGPWPYPAYPPYYFPPPG